MNRLPLLAAGLFLAAGCSLYGPRQPPPETWIEGVRKPAPAKLLLIETPKVVREAHSHPVGETRHAFFWAGQQAEWRFRLPGRGYGHAGFRFYRAHNVKPYLATTELRFTLRPASMARYLWVGLIDGDDEPPQVLVDLPLSDVIPLASGDGEIDVRIPLTRFPEFGQRVVVDTDMDPSFTPFPFDWQDVLHIRFLHNGGRMPERDVSITNLRLVR
jgi:hypothetical protein